MVLERDYQRQLIATLEAEFPGCVILKNDSSYVQGIPDLLVLWNDRWAMLEVKAEFDSPERPNQGWWVERLNEMSFSAFIFPENEREVLDALQHTFQARRTTRVPRR